MSQDNVELVRRAWEHFISTQVVPEELLAPDFVWDMSPFGAWLEQPYYEGVEGVHAFLHDWSEPFDDLAYVVEGYHDVGDDVVTVIRQHGRAKASGVPVEMRYAVVTSVRNGLQTRAKVYAEPDEAFKAVGLQH